MVAEDPGEGILGQNLFDVGNHYASQSQMLGLKVSELLRYINDDLKVFGQICS